MDDPHYRLAPGIDVVPLHDGNLLLQSDSMAVRLEGSSAMFFAEEVLPLLNGKLALSEVCAHFPTLTLEELRPYLDELVGKDVLRRTDSPVERSSSEINAPTVSILEDLGLPETDTRRLLESSAVAIVGLEAHGAHLALALARLGVGKLVLADPYPCQPGNIALMPPLGEAVIGKPRQTIMQETLAPFMTRPALTRGQENLTRENIQAIADDGCQVLVGCFDKGFSSTSVWINQLSLEAGIPSLHGRLAAHVATVGPLVLPGETACYLCWRMRSIACEDRYEDVMAYEEFLDRQRRPAQHERSVLPFLPSFAASLLAMEILKQLLGVATPSLASKVLEFNGLTLQAQTHQVLQKPDCSACKKKVQNSNLLSMN